MRTDQDIAVHPRTTPPAPHRCFLLERRVAWYSHDDGTAASLPAVLSRQISPSWIADDGTLIQGLYDGQLSPLQVAYMYHAMSPDDPLDTPRNEYPQFDHSKWAAEAEAAEAERQRQIAADVYFIGMKDGPIKIGISGNIKSRLRALQTSNPIPLTLLATTDGGGLMEAEYHRRFAKHRLSGEWFQRCPEIEAEINRLNEVSQ